ncbi:DUF6804 family protein [Elizabethkingia meningoseptica]|uniref:DUF6804 family protein n=1 Tax=Elizabethkingia meningoseptica TaxID=238 RepID=UPI0023AF653D|nr:DUF6804 family protein [Elizabethkingia meningoseptica]MDE5432542.1 hypothetical protein [Elizabethkingia meningoseptica]
MKYFFLFCATCCFVAILRLPIDYYTFLRIIVFTGAAIAIYHLIRNKIYFWAGIFGCVLILFNPLFPVYLHRKTLWMPLDVITGILFLCLNFIKKSQPEEQKEIMPLPKDPVVHARDRILSPRSLTNKK